MNYKIVSLLMAGVMGAALMSSTAQAGFQWTAPSGVAATASTGTGSMPRVPAAPVAPVMSEGLPGSMADMQAANVIPTTPDGPVAAAPIYGQGPQGPMTNDPITWNTPAAQPRAPQSVLPAETQTLYPAAAPMAAAPVIATPVTPAAQPSIWPPVMASAQPAMIASSTTVTTTPTAQVTYSAPSPVGYGAYELAEGFGNDLPLVMAIRQVVPASYGFVFDEGVNLSTNVSWQGGRPWNLVLSDMLTPLNLRAAINGNVVSILPAGQAPAMMQQISMTGPAVSTDMVAHAGAYTANAPVMMAPAPIAAISPAVMQGPAITMTPAAAGGVDLGATTTWTAPRNSTLRSILEDWSDRVNVELYWASEYDYPVQSAVSINGSFEEAVQTLLRGLNESKPRPLGRLHPNLPNGPAVLVIETRQNAM